MYLLIRFLGKVLIQRKYIVDDYSKVLIYYLILNIFILVLYFGIIFVLFMPIKKTLHIKKTNKKLKVKKQIN